ncbi:LLM class flavin-dependent oxidoreductase [Mycolicibacterium hodleri]|uniref:LLM class flavin-dependent oxidoreductase n=1 Tax=Mycolicibacterium hodleri TaxID=49897 RepID=A0A502DRN0_9MYCO|nr:LLM class flavin-dependent oxidoreductase [Mycolicibacterium hodleri]TPG27370.1 LLM class flavin-dependent oxidoreductase [Mycolicibacterium hodleri]
MKVGALIEPRAPGAAEFAVAAERLGVASLWVPEVWGYDALTGLAFLAAKTTDIGLGTFVVQLGSRSPALLATSALSLQELSGGRFTLGLGTSGPGVMEGWHGVRFRRPVQTTRETVEIIRIISRGERLEHSGEIYPLPLPDGDGSVLRPLVRPAHVPVYNAAMGPQNLRLTGEVADGWLGNAFIPEASEVFLGPLREGAELAGRTLADLDLVAPVAVEFADSREEGDAAARRHAEGYAFTIGAMGVRSGGQERSDPGRYSGRNFYSDAFSRLGYGDEVRTVTELWRAGRREEARRAVPLDLGRLTNLVGTDDAIADRIGRYRDVGITTLLAKLDGDYDAQLTALERLIAIVADQ